MLTKLINAIVSMTILLTLLGSRSYLSSREKVLDNPAPPNTGIIELTILPKVPGIANALIPINIKVNSKSVSIINTTSQKFMISGVSPTLSKPNYRAC